MMKLHSDFTQPLTLRLADVKPVPSPAPGVFRRMLERDGGEGASGTSLVRYEPGSRFPEHRHDRGEEFYVVSGTFCDEHGTYPAGTYVRNPWGSQHTPFSPEGCELFVKIRQLPGTQARLVVVPHEQVWRPVHLGVTAALLHEQGMDQVTLERWEPGTERTLERCEALLLKGTLVSEQAITWFRLPGLAETFRATSRCLWWIKRGHLPASTNPG